MFPIAVDAMGGDHAPGVVIDGVLDAVQCLPAIEKIYLVGDENRLQNELKQRGTTHPDTVEIAHAPDVTEMDEPGASALRSKPKSSIAVACDLVKKGEAGGLVSAGNTGATVASAILKLRTLQSVDRPGIATVFPTPATTDGSFLLIDAGANLDTKSDHLISYAVMGEIYAREILKISSPRIGLLNVGEEAEKGNDVLKQTHKQLNERTDIRFIGNIEANKLFAGEVDVIVCDGFSGNVVLKCTEGLAGMFSGYLKQFLQKNVIRKLGALLSKNAFRELKQLSDYAEYGGAPLLGVNGICIVGHGSSSPKAIKNAIRVSAESLEQGVNSQIESRLNEE